MTVVDETQAVILSGGGGYGAYEVGIMKALLGGEMAGAGYRRIEPGIFTGTSVGSFNAAIMASQPGVPSGRQQKIWSAFGSTRSPARQRDAAMEYSGFVETSCASSIRVVTRIRLLRLNKSEPMQGLSGRVFSAGGLNALMTQGSLANRALQFVDLSALISVEPFREMLDKTIPSQALRRFRPAVESCSNKLGDG